MKITLDKVIAMMKFLGYTSYIIHHDGLPLPSVADGDNYRQTKIFRLYSSGTLYYHGTGYRVMGKDVPNIDIFEIDPPQAFIDRAYSFIISTVRNKITSKTKDTGMKRIKELILKFNGLDFIDI